MADLRLRYQTLEFRTVDIHLCTLRDRLQFSDPYGIAEKLGISSAAWPIFGVIWPSSLALARFIDSYSTAGKRILEVGCGIALPSLLLSSKKADITATDYHPDVEEFLIRNTELNSRHAIPFERTGWADKNDALGTFDLVIGSDLLYEDAHIELLVNFIHSHCKPNCEVILVDPGRGRKTKVSKKMITLGYSSSMTQIPQVATEKGIKGHILRFIR
ncbi:Uncharacterised protein [BD1-7 clade bacterium]|uniref:Histidine kinase n=1 Tax=BD1-7 clade bacterium TaxID=2029982 RepID=A0A5S9P776_9GAMM|nr:Uncharacterised protein [BD1-7 clade bacterium]CAA0099522.1 Uncharacterised protein [BD1-7 clade bacterium]